MQVEEWDLTPTPIPPRSRLMAPVPRGLGTLMVESLASYLFVLAGAHLVSVGRLVAKQFLVRMPDGRCRPWLDSGRLPGALAKNSHAISGLGEIAFAFTHVATELTGRTDIAQLTLLHGFSWLHRLGVVRPTLAYCPTCFEEMGPDGAYLPLIWSIRPVKMCGVHGLRLVDVCPNSGCARQIPVLTCAGRPGACPHCRAALADGPKLDSTPEERDWQRYVIGQLTPFLVREIPVESADIRGATAAVIGASGPSKTELSIELSTSKVNLTGWAAGRVQPSLESLLRLCYLANVELTEFIQGRCQPNGTPRHAHPGWPRVERSLVETSWPEVEAMLRAELEAPETRGWRAILRDIGRDRRTVAERFPDLVEQLKSRHAQRRASDVARTRAIQDAAVESATAQLIAEGITPSRMRVEAIVGFQVRNRVLRVWRQARDRQPNSAGATA